MMPDSTQTGEKKAKKRKSGKKKGNSVKKKKLAGKKANEAEAVLNSDNEYDSDLNPNKELKPIGGYIKNREEMLDHVFKCVSGEKLQSMLPDILKNVPLAELKTLCLDQLEVMSKKRIQCILDGLEMTSSSGTDDSSSEEEHTYKVQGEDKKSRSVNDSRGNVMDESEVKLEEAIIKGEDSDTNDGSDDGIVDSTTEQRDQQNENDDDLEMALSLSPQHSGGSDSLFNDNMDEEDITSIHGDSNKVVMDEHTMCKPACQNIEDECVEGGLAVDLDAIVPCDGEGVQLDVAVGGYGPCDEEGVHLDVAVGEYGPCDGEGVHLDVAVGGDGPCDGEGVHLDVTVGGDGGQQEDDGDGAGLSETSEPPVVHSQLEILELEMRARAIRSLMTANEKRETVLKRIKLQRSQLNTS